MVLAHIQLATPTLSCMQYVDSWLGIRGPTPNEILKRLNVDRKAGTSFQLWGVTHTVCISMRVFLLGQAHVIMGTLLCHSGRRSTAGPLNVFAGRVVMQHDMMGLTGVRVSNVDVLFWGPSARALSKLCL